MTTFKQTPFLFGNLMDDFFPTTSAYYPPVNIYENEKGFSIELKIPGVKKEEVSIQMEKGLLTISFQQVENKDEKLEKLIKKEFASILGKYDILRIKNFKRTFSLDEKINSEAIDAKMENGILTLSLPLKESSNAPKKLINIK